MKIKVDLIGGGKTGPNCVITVECVSQDQNVSKMLPSKILFVIDIGAGGLPAIFNN